jgi:hypothetical protein
MLIDTDVLIWMTRCHAGAAAKLQTITPWRISAVTYMELAQGCRQKAASLMPHRDYSISAAISDRAMQLIDAHTPSHSMQLGEPDAYADYARLWPRPIRNSWGCCRVIL